MMVVARESKSTIRKSEKFRISRLRLAGTFSSLSRENEVWKNLIRCAENVAAFSKFSL